MFEPFFVQPPSGGLRLCILTPPVGAVRGAILHVHAFGEEMNKSRRMCALGARALARAGFAVLQIDLLGCGDSTGDLGDATWDNWIDDLHFAANWLQQRYASAPLWLWGHRAGALLAGTMLPRHPTANLLLWNPVVHGKAVTQQMFRLLMAANWANSDGGRVASAKAKADLAAGLTVEIAGYRLAPTMVAALDAAELAPAAPGSGRELIWLEAAGREVTPPLSPSAQSQVARWRSAGWHAQAQAIEGPLFWQAVEIEDAPQLIDATTALITKLHDATETIA